MAYLVGILHPSYIQRGAWQEEPAQVLYLKRAKRIADTGTAEVLDQTQPPPNTLLYPTLTQFKEWEDGLWETCPTCNGNGTGIPAVNHYYSDSGLTLVTDPCHRCEGSGYYSQGVTVDIEAAGPHITIVGLCRMRDFVPIVLRFRGKGGRPWHTSYSELYETVEVLDEVLGDPHIPKVFQNGQAYDVPQLERVGFVVRGYFDGGFDTMLGAHICYAEMSKDLEYLANIYAGLAGWKHLVAEGEAK